MSDYPDSAEAQRPHWANSGLFTSWRRARAQRRGRRAEAERLATAAAAAPFAAAVGRAAVHRFLADPAGFAAGQPEAGDLSAVDPLTLALGAQSLACRNDHRGAANKMAASLRGLGAPDAADEPDASAARHRALLRALGGTFLQKQAELASLDPAKAWPDLCAKADLLATGITAFPEEPYLHQERYAALRRAGRFGEMLEAIMHWVAASATKPEVAALAAIEAAVAGLAAGPEDSGRDALLAAAARLLAATASNPDAVRRPDLGESEIAYWQGRVALAIAETGGDAQAEATEAVHAFETAADGANARVAEAARTWLPDARRLQALHRFHRSGRTIRDLHDAFCANVDAEDLVLQPLPVDAPAAPRGRARRIVLDLSVERFGDGLETVAQDIIGEPEARDPSALTLVTLRLRWLRRYGIALPGVQLRAVAGLPGPIRVLLDGEPIGPSVTDERMIKPSAPTAPALIVRALDNSARLYLDGFVEPEMAASLGLSGYASESWMPFVRLLLSEQTTLAARPALRAAVSGIEAGTLDIVEAVRRYRLNDAVRPRLWGQHDRRLRLQLSADEDELAACLGDDSPAVPEALIQRILDGVKAQLDAVAQQGQRQGNSAAAAGQSASSREAQESQPRITGDTGSNSAIPLEREVTDDVAIIVARPDIRPWLRILIRPQHPDRPVLSEEELLE